MVPISVPFAPTPYKIVAGVPLLIFGALALYWGGQEPPPLHPDVARQITIAAGEQPSFRRGWRSSLSRGSGGGRGCDFLLRCARDNAANDHFAGWNSCWRGTTALSTKIDSLGRDHKSHL